MMNRASGAPAGYSKLYSTPYCVAGPALGPSGRAQVVGQARRRVQDVPVDHRVVLVVSGHDLEGEVRTFRRQMLVDVVAPRRVARRLVVVQVAEREVERRGR